MLVRKERKVGTTFWKLDEKNKRIVNLHHKQVGGLGKNEGRSKIQNKTNQL